MRSINLKILKEEFIRLSEVILIFGCRFYGINLNINNINNTNYYNNKLKNIVQPTYIYDNNFQNPTNNNNNNDQNNKYLNFNTKSNIFYAV